MITVAVYYQLSYLWPPNLRPSSRSTAAASKLSKGVGLCGGGGLPSTSPPVQAVGAQVASGYIPDDTLSTCYSSVSFSFSIFLCIAASWAGVDKKYLHYWCRTTEIFTWTALWKLYVSGFDGPMSKNFLLMQASRVWFLGVKFNMFSCWHPLGD